MIKSIKIDGDPKKVGTKINYIYISKYNALCIIEEINSFFQEGNEDDNNEWNYKYKIIENGISTTFNVIFISCKNGSKTYISFENNINEKQEIGELILFSKKINSF